MKKYVALLSFLILTSVTIFAQQSINIKAIVAPVGANITMNSYLWNIALANDGTTSYQNDQQGVMTVKSGSTWLFHIDFSSEHLGYVKQGAYQIPYYVQVTEITSSYSGFILSSSIMDGYVQLTSTQSIWFLGRTPKAGIRFYVGIKIDATSGQFFESGTYTDTLTINFVAL
ncbi:MAG: hypothetical protein SAMD01599839_03240 [Rectinema sp.]